MRSSYFNFIFLFFNIIRESLKEGKILSWTTQSGNYVKFLRGTPAAWEAQVNPNPDTLYFIAETNATKGKLYLGSKLISDGFVNNISSLADLSDILIENNIPSNSLLMYNSTTHKWVPTTLATIFSLIVGPMRGATVSTNGESGLVPAPLAGDQKKYLRGDGTWADPTVLLTGIINGLIDQDTGKSIRTIAQEEVALIVDNAPQAFDTLKEIADWIGSNTDAADIIALDNRVDDLEEALFGQDGTGTTDGLILDVQNLTTNYSTLSTTVNNIEQTIRWQDMIEE